MNEIASNYADALLSVAKDNNCVKAFRDEIQEVNDAFNETDKLKEFFACENIYKEDKKKVLEASFKDKVNPLIINFLKVLVDKGRINMYKEIFKAFRTLANQELNIKEGIVESARPLDKKQIELLEESLGENVELIPRINKDLISGFKIIIENQVIDNSMKDKIDDLSSLLLGRS